MIYDGRLTVLFVCVFRVFIHAIGIGQSRLPAQTLLDNIHLCFKRPSYGQKTKVLSFQLSAESITNHYLNIHCERYAYVRTSRHNRFAYTHLYMLLYLFGFLKRSIIFTAKK